MAQAILRPEEQRAGEILLELTGADEIEPRDVGGATGMYDFDVVKDGALLASVEVTIAADKASLRTWNEKTLRRHRRCDGLSLAWCVTWSKIETRKLKNAMPTVCQQLALLEQEGINHLETAADTDDDEEGRNEVEELARTTLRELGVFDVEIYESLPAGAIVNASVSADFAAWDAVETAAEVAAAVKAVQLAKAPKEVEHILFLWISPTLGELRSQLLRWQQPRFGEPPRPLEDLPPEVDTVVVGVDAEDSDIFHRGTREGWSSINLELS
jgi:hypothetical protein